jgi:chitinase
MSTIGGGQSFWQQDQSYWSNQSGWSSSISATNAVNNALFSAETTLGKGMSAIANGQALTRVNNQIKSGIQDYIKAVSGSSSGSTATKAAPATATSTKAVSVSSTLSSLGILQNGSVYVTAGKNTTAYTSTGSDTIGDLISTLNTNLPGNAQVTASINSQGRLAITSKNTTDQINISGVFASNLGFAVGNQSFKPTQATAPAASTTTSASTSSSKSTSTSSKSSTAGLPSAFTLSAGSAATLLASSGASGSLVNLLA